MRTARTGGGITNRSRRTGVGITNRVSKKRGEVTLQKSRPSTVPQSVSPIRQKARDARAKAYSQKKFSHVKETASKQKGGSPKLPAIVLHSPVRRAPHCRAHRVPYPPHDAALTGAAALHNADAPPLNPSTFESDPDRMMTARDGLILRMHKKLTEHSLDDSNQNLFSTFKWLARAGTDKNPKPTAGIGFKDFDRALKHMGIKSSPALSKTTFKFLDNDGNGKLGFDEFAQKVSKVSIRRLEEKPKNSKFAKSHSVQSLGQLQSKKKLMHMPKDLGFVDFDGDGFIDAEELSAFYAFKKKNKGKVVTKESRHRFWAKRLLDQTGPHFNLVTKGIGSRQPKRGSRSSHQGAQRKINPQSSHSSPILPPKPTNGIKSPESVIESMVQMPAFDFQRTCGLIKQRIRSVTLRSSIGAGSAIFNADDDRAQKRWAAELQEVAARRNRNKSPRLLSKTNAIARERSARKVNQFEDFQSKHYGYSGVTKHMYK